MKEKIKKALYNFGEAVPEVLVVTVIPAIYRNISARMEGRRDAKGWWRCAAGIYDGKDILLAEAPQRSGPADALTALEGFRNAVFLGYCGSLKDEYAVGSVTFAKTAGNGERLVDSPLSIGMPQVRVREVKSLLGESYLGIDADVIDMETFLFYQKAAESAGVYASFLLVTDMPLAEGRRFFEVGKEEAEKNSEKFVRCLGDYLKATSMPL